MYFKCLCANQWRVIYRKTQYWMDPEHNQITATSQNLNIRWICCRCLCANQWWAISRMIQHWMDPEQWTLSNYGNIRWICCECQCAGQWRAISRMTISQLIEVGHSSASDGPFLRWPSIEWIMKACIWDRFFLGVFTLWFIVYA